MKTIGIKLADGSFFPVMEDNHPAAKALELTTAHNNQTKVMVDLYRSKTCSMDDAEYVDSLQIDNLISHPNGEPSIAFSVSLDRNSRLSANIRDPETGYESKTAIPLVTRSEEELQVADEYKISNIIEDTTKPIFGDDALPDLTKEQEPSAPTDNTEITEEPEPQTEEEVPVENNEEEKTEAEIQEEIIPETPEEENNNIPETEETEFEAPSEQIEEEPETVADQEENDIVPQTEDFEEPEYDQPQEEAVEEEIIPTPEDFTITDDYQETPVTDMPEEEPETEIEPVPETDSESENFDLPDFDDELEKSIEESQALNNMFSNNDNNDDSDNNFTEETFPDFDDIKSDDEVFGLPDNLDNSDNLNIVNSDDSDDDFDVFSQSSSPIDDFSLPDFPEDNSDPELPDNFFDDFEDTPNFDNEPAPASGSGPLSFTGLYDKETEMGMSGENFSKHTKVPVIVCIICALICIIATAFILFAKPKENKNNITDPKQQEIVVEPQKGSSNKSDSQIKVVETEPAKPIVPAAKENEVIIIEKAENVIPVQPEVIKAKLHDISYKVIWGDTLWDIANTYYKNPWRYTDIAKYNNIKNPDYIISGTTIVIPAE